MSEIQTIGGKILILQHNSHSTCGKRNTNEILHIPCNSTVTNSVIAILKDIEYEKVQMPNMALKETMMHIEVNLHCFMKQWSTNRLAQHRLPRTGKKKWWGRLTALLKNTNGGKGRQDKKKSCHQPQLWRSHTCATIIIRDLGRNSGLNV